MSRIRSPPAARRILLEAVRFRQSVASSRRYHSMLERFCCARLRVCFRAFSGDFFRHFFFLARIAVSAALAESKLVRLIDRNKSARKKPCRIALWSKYSLLMKMRAVSLRSLALLQETPGHFLAVD